MRALYIRKTKQTSTLCSVQVLAGYALAKFESSNVQENPGA
jgi:glycine cleavage system pyridoxal-binding protein P